MLGASGASVLEVADATAEFEVARRFGGRSQFALVSSKGGARAFQCLEPAAGGRRSFGFYPLRAAQYCICVRLVSLFAFAAGADSGNFRNLIFSWKGLLKYLRKSGTGLNMKLKRCDFQKEVEMIRAKRESGHASRSDILCLASENFRRAAVRRSAPQGGAIAASRAAFPIWPAGNFPINMDLIDIASI